MGWIMDLLNLILWESILNRCCELTVVVLLTAEAQKEKTWSWIFQAHNMK